MMSVRALNPELNEIMEQLLKHIPEDIVQQCKKIKAVICDVDGVLTDGGIIYDNDGKEYKKFNVKDGQIIKHLKQAGVLVGAITGRDSPVVRFRCTELKMDFHYHGSKEKWRQYEQVKQDFGLNDEEILYIGDDIIDLSIFTCCGLAVAPVDAVPYVKDYATYITKAKGGEGVLREVGDMVLAAKGLLKKIIVKYEMADRTNMKMPK